MLTPRKAVPALKVPTLAHGEFDLQNEKPAHFTMVVFYRGLHCPICAKYLLELGRMLPDFAQRGVSVIAVSSDTRERAQAMADKVNAPNLRLGYGLALPGARDWGLYISTSRGVTSIGIEEPALFCGARGLPGSPRRDALLRARCRRCRSRARTSTS